MEIHRFLVSGQRLGLPVPEASTLLLFLTWPSVSRVCCPGSLLMSLSTRKVGFKLYWLTDVVVGKRNCLYPSVLMLPLLRCCDPPPPLTFKLAALWTTRNSLTSCGTTLETKGMVSVAASEACSGGKLALSAGAVAAVTLPPILSLLALFTEQLDFLSALRKALDSQLTPPDEHEDETDSSFLTTATGSIFGIDGSPDPQAAAAPTLLTVSTLLASPSVGAAAAAGVVAAALGLLLLLL